MMNKKENKKRRLPGKKSDCSREVCEPLKLFRSFGSPLQNAIEILISGSRTFFFLIFVGSNQQIQLEKCLF
jgi:hypothetical protein